MKLALVGDPKDIPRTQGLFGHVRFVAGGLKLYVRGLFWPWSCHSGAKNAQNTGQQLTVLALSCGGFWSYRGVSVELVACPDPEKPFSNRKSLGTARQSYCGTTI